MIDDRLCCSQIPQELPLTVQTGAPRGRPIRPIVVRGPQPPPLASGRPAGATLGAGLSTRFSRGASRRGAAVTRGIHSEPLWGMSSAGSNGKYAVSVRDELSLGD